MHLPVVIASLMDTPCLPYVRRIAFHVPLTDALAVRRLVQMANAISALALRSDRRDLVYHRLLVHRVLFP